MSRDRPKKFSLQDERDYNFEEDDYILNYRPKIDFIEPPQIEGDEEAFRELEGEEPPPTEIEALRKRTEDLIKGYDAVKKLTNVAQQRIDARVATGGGVQVKLDPVKDAHTVAAMKRRFPEKADPTVITYDDYKQVLDCISKHSPEIDGVSSTAMAAEMKAAKADPLRTDFGGLSNQRGENRPEISSSANSVSPIDLSAFQAAGIIALFALMLPLIKAEDTKSILAHLATAPHKPL